MFLLSIPPKEGVLVSGGSFIFWVQVIMVNRMAFPIGEKSFKRWSKYAFKRNLTVQFTHMGKKGGDINWHLIGIAWKYEM